MFTASIGDDSLLWKNVLSASNFSCFQIDGYITAKQLMFFDNQDILFGVVNLTSIHHTKFRLTFNLSLSEPIVWEYTIYQNNGYIQAHSSDSVLTDDNTLFSAINFNFRNIIYELNSTTGDITGIMMKTTIDWSYVYQMNIINNQLYIIHGCGTHYLTVYDLTTLEMNQYTFNVSHIRIYEVIAEYNTDRIILAGVHLDGSRYSYLSSVTNSTISLLQYVTEDALILENITDGSYSMVATNNTFTIANYNWDETGPPSDSDLIVQGHLSSVSDTSYFLDPYYNYDLAESENYTLNISLTCSVSGNTQITYTLAGYNGSTLPDWVSLDSENAQLSVQAPEVSSDTYFTFAIDVDSSEETQTFQQIIYLKIIAWQSDNWMKCITDTTDQWETWNSGYYFYSGGSVCEESEVSDTVKAGIVSTQVITGVSCGVSIASSMISLSSFQAIWL